MSTAEAEAIFRKLEKIDERLRAMEIRASSHNYDDHEGRLRKLERVVWLGALVAAGGGGLLGSGGGALLKLLMGA